MNKLAQIVLLLMIIALFIGLSWGFIYCLYCAITTTRNTAPGAVICFIGMSALTSFFTGMICEGIFRR